VDQAAVEKAVKNALQVGYRHIDCAAVYQDEAAVGRGIKASGIPREEIFVITQLTIVFLQYRIN
jgi:L-glyceraldehyde reductase